MVKGINKGDQNMKTEAQFQLEIIGFNTYMTNWVAEIQFNGKTYQALRQGVIGIWAFPARIKMNRVDQDLLDKHLDAALAKFKTEKKV